MNLNWSNRVIKYVLFFFNFMLVISGIILVAVGASVKGYFTQYDIFLNDSYFSLPNLLIATGCLVFFISFFGCCGAVRESWFMIFIFSVLLSLIFILEFSAGIAGYVLRDQTYSYLTTSLRTSMNNYEFMPPTPTPTPTPTTEQPITTKTTLSVKPTTASPTVASSPAASPGKQNTRARRTAAPAQKKPNADTKMWDLIQSEFECCGINSAKDWTLLVKPKNKPDNTSLPASCCRPLNGATGQTNCNYNDQSTATFYTNGCVSAFGRYCKEHAVTIGGTAMAIAFIQLFGVVFACHLARQIKHGFYST